MTPWARKMAERQAAGLCRVCGEPQVPGCALCETHRDEQRARRRARYAKKKAAGKCQEGTCARPVAPGRIRCAACQAAQRVYNSAKQREYRAARKASDDEPNGKT